MLTDQDIRATLSLLDQQFNNSANVTDTAFCSKLALIELCGWIEEAMDEIVSKCSSRCLQDSRNIKYCNSIVVRRNAGFDYENNFRKMLIQLLGLVGVEKIEAGVDQAKLVRLNAALSILKGSRDGAAHTYLKAGTAATLAAPSLLIAQFSPVYDGLLDLDQFITARQW